MHLIDIYRDYAAGKTNHHRFRVDIRGTISHAVLLNMESDWQVKCCYYGDNSIIIQ